MSEVQDARAVNAYDGGSGQVIAAFMVADEWVTIRMSSATALELADQIRLLTRTTD